MDRTRLGQPSKSIAELNNELSGYVHKLEQKFKRNNFKDTETYELVRHIANCAHPLNEQLQLMSPQIPIAKTIRQLLTFSSGAIHLYEAKEMPLYYDALFEYLRPQMKLYEINKSVLNKL